MKKDDDFIKQWMLIEMICIFLKQIMDIQKVLNRNITNRKKVDQIEYLTFHCLENDLGGMMVHLVNNFAIISMIQHQSEELKLTTSIVSHKNMKWVLYMN